MEAYYYKAYYQLEREHWWFRARLEILSSMISNRIYKGKSLKILNAGVATGATSKMLESFGEVTSLEYDKDCCHFLKEELKMDVIQGSLTDLPFKDNSFDLVCAFDVIEHIQDDQKAVHEIKRVLKQDQKFFVTVPAYQFLWSEHDEVNYHFRRYTRTQLGKLFSEAGLRVNLKSYFNAILFPPIALVRTLSKLLPNKNTESQENRSDFEKYTPGSLSDKVLYRIFKTERFFLKRGVRFPFGVSILMIGEKADP
ncbi:class I SAM-dependent methyltransferase [Portibacter marinus]|uniref:class I SAM-dependent methyltransferase n=1 Tax=Portibacter marinus TaxID=2898660 RepID=UPI001F3C36C2|nr:class I SAM-dependent methyltransferase [Portibacter marinus]